MTPDALRAAPALARDARSTDTLDPADWDAFRALAHRMVDDSLDFLRTLPDRRAWTPLPADVRTALATERVPHESQGEAQVYEEFLSHVLPYSNGSRSPQFFGWVQGNGTPLGMMADMLAAGMNAHMAGFNDAPRVVEERVIAWLAELMGFPATSGCFERLTRRSVPAVSWRRSETGMRSGRAAMRTSEQEYV